MIELYDFVKAKDPTIHLPLATIDSWPLLLDERSMQELLQNEPHLLNRIPSSQGQYMTEPGVWQPMSQRACIYVLKSILGTEVEECKDFKYTNHLQYKTADGQTGRISVGAYGEFFISDALISLFESPQGKEAELALLKKLAKHIEDRRDQIMEYREQQFGPEPEPKKSRFSFRR